MTPDGDGQAFEGASHQLSDAQQLAVVKATAAGEAEGFAEVEVNGINAARFSTRGRTVVEVDTEADGDDTVRFELTPATLRLVRMAARADPDDVSDSRGGGGG